MTSAILPSHVVTHGSALSFARNWFRDEYVTQSWVMSHERKLAGRLLGKSSALWEGEVVPFFLLLLDVTCSAYDVRMGQLSCNKGSFLENILKVRGG